MPNTNFTKAYSYKYRPRSRVHFVLGSNTFYFLVGLSLPNSQVITANVNASVTKCNLISSVSVPYRAYWCVVLAYVGLGLSSFYKFPQCGIGYLYTGSWPIPA